MTVTEKQATSVVVPVILCGGSGTRLWPLSRESYPKQFLKLAVAKNTAPSLTLASLQANELYEDAVLIVLPADHAICDDQDFCATVATAISSVSADDIEIATLGVTPSYAETGYGYIECQTDSPESSYHKITRFVEKPNLELAQQYIAQSNFYWNSGVFIIKSQFWLTAIEKFDSDILREPLALGITKN